METNNVKIMLKTCMKMVEGNTEYICLKENNDKCCGGGRPFCHSIENCGFKCEIILVDKKQVK